jgi:hypothetical protein
LNITTGSSRLTSIPGIAESRTELFPGRKHRPRALANQPAFFLRQCSVEMQHEGVGIDAELGNDERHTLGHQGRNEGHVSRKPVELGHYDRAALGAACGQRCGELRPAIQGIGALAGFHLDEIGD